MTVISQWVIVGNPENRRVIGFGEALARRGYASPRVVSYLGILSGRGCLESLPTGAVVRVDSPGENFAVERLLLALGGEGETAEPYYRLTPEGVAQLEEDRGQIVAPRQWYRGYLAAIRHVAEQAQPSQIWTTAPRALEIQFDKPLCQEGCAAKGIPIPQPIGLVAGWDDLWERMKAGGHHRVFVKLANSSSASGVVAIEQLRGKFAATTSVEMVGSADEVKLYNSLAIRRYTHIDEIRLLVDTLAKHRAWSEAWLPKASLDRRVCDLRLLVIAGEPRHAVVRTSRSPLTNLHLGNRRGNLDEFWRRVPDEQRAALELTCRRVAELFPESLHLGLDILFTPGFRQHYLLEVNAFGDLLPGVIDRGLGTYEAEIKAVEKGWRPADGGELGANATGVGEDDRCQSSSSAAG